MVFAPGHSSGMGRDLSPVSQDRGVDHGPRTAKRPDPNAAAPAKKAPFIGDEVAQEDKAMIYPDGYEWVKDNEVLRAKFNNLKQVEVFEIPKKL